MEWKFFIVIFLVLFFVSFALQNPGETVITFLKWQTPSIPLVYLLVFSLGIGMILAGFFSMVKRIKLHNEINRLKKRIKSQDDELKRLRTLSLVGSPGENDQGDASFEETHSNASV